MSAQGERAPREAPISLRLPEPLRNRLADTAARNERSFNAQAIRWLELGADAEEGLGDKAEEEPVVVDVRSPEARPTNPPLVDGTTVKEFRPDFKTPTEKKERSR